jgi:hypothetical protein
MGVGLFGGVVKIFGRGEGLVQVHGCLLVASDVGVGDAKEPVGADSDGQAGQVFSGVRRGLPYGERIVTAPPPVMEVTQGPGELPHGGVPAVGDGGLVGGQDIGVFSVEPGDRGRYVRQRLGVGAGRGRIEPDLRAVRIQDQVGGVGGVQVEVDHAAQRVVPLGVAVVGVGLVGRVGAEQVVEGVPAGGAFADQVRPAQLVERAAGAGEVEGGQPGCRGRPMSAPGCRPSRRNTRADSGVRAR